MQPCPLRRPRAPEGSAHRTHHDAEAQGDGSAVSAPGRHTVGGDGCRRLPHGHLRGWQVLPHLVGGRYRRAPGDRGRRHRPPDRLQPAAARHHPGRRRRANPRRRPAPDQPDRHRAGRPPRGAHDGGRVNHRLRRAPGCDRRRPGRARGVDGGDRLRCLVGTLHRQRARHPAPVGGPR